MKRIDLRSDTVTLPTEEMRKAMYLAEVGDDVYQDDPTVLKLQKKAAEMLGKEDALFVMSGTMGNLLSIMSQTHHGDELITGRNNHIITHEVGGLAALCGVMTRLVNNDNDMVYPEDIEKAMRPDDIHEPRSVLVCLENALSNGTVVPLDVMRKDYETAKRLGLNVHLDGARLFNAALALNCDVKDIAACADSVMFCLSKGLGAPMGSMICGTKEFIAKARRNRKRIGGGGRQMGHMAACGLVALDVMTKRLYEDHDNAKYLASQLREIDGVHVQNEPEISMVFFSVDTDEKKFMELCQKHHILMNPSDHGFYRVVTHVGVEKEDLDVLVECIKEAVSWKK
ncbi:MAG: low specificity L-threonine aldolase [Erysipelotrichaceae bacterium]|nr:low specificity L-threonine aldolase [Erysipelotrichaceae bacterium]